MPTKKRLWKDIKGVSTSQDDVTKRSGIPRELSKGQEEGKNHSVRRSHDRNDLQEDDTGAVVQCCRHKRDPHGGVIRRNTHS